MTPGPARSSRPKLAIDPVMLTGEDSPDLVAEARAHGFAELVVPPRVIDGPRAAAWRASLEGAGSRILAVQATSELTPYLDGSLSDKVERRRAPVLRRLKALYGRMATLGARWLIVVPGRVAENYQTEDEARDTYVQSLRELAEAAPDGLGILAATIPLRLTGTSAQLHSVLQEAGDARLGAAADLGHLLLAGERPVAAATALGASLHLILLDDASLTPGAPRLDRHLPPGAGALQPADVARLAGLCACPWSLNVRAPAGREPWGVAQEARAWLAQAAAVDAGGE